MVFGPLAGPARLVGGVAGRPAALPRLPLRHGLPGDPAGADLARRARRPTSRSCTTRPSRRWPWLPPAPTGRRCASSAGWCRTSGSTTPSRCSHRLRHRWPDLRLLVVGHGWAEDDLRARVAELGLGDRVELLGWVDERTKHQVLARSWVHLCPSLKEGWGRAVMEAATHGVPTVAYAAAGGVTETVLAGTHRAAGRRPGRLHRPGRAAARGPRPAGADGRPRHGRTRRASPGPTRSAPSRSWSSGPGRAGAAAQRLPYSYSGCCTVAVLSGVCRFAATNPVAAPTASAPPRMAEMTMVTGSAFGGSFIRTDRHPTSG